MSQTIRVHEELVRFCFLAAGHSEAETEEAIRRIRALSEEELRTLPIHDLTKMLFGSAN